MAQKKLAKKYSNEQILYLSILALILLLIPYFVAAVRVRAISPVY